MAIDEIIEQVSTRARPLVLVTGGEPLAQSGCMGLLERLSSLGCLVQLETSGAFSIADVPVGISRILDIKTPGSGESKRNRLENLALLRSGDEIKFVITSRADYEWSREFIESHALAELELPILFSPCWGAVSPEDMCRWMLEDRMPARLQLQMHKMIWGAEAAGV